nr:MAG TPA: hypothetical protein [Caudoviricetes sp.]
MDVAKKYLSIYKITGDRVYLADAVKAELEEWLLSGDVDYLHKAMAVIRAEIKKEDEDEEEKSKAS